MPTPSTRRVAERQMRRLAARPVDIRALERELDVLVAVGDALRTEARGFGARLAAEMSVAEAQDVVSGFEENAKALQTYKQNLVKTIRGAPPADVGDLDRLLDVAQNRINTMHDGLRKAETALQQYKKDTTRGKLRTGFARLLKFAKAQWPVWSSFDVGVEKAIHYVEDVRGGYGEGSIYIKGLSWQDPDMKFLLVLGYRASDGQMWGSFDGIDIFDKMGGKWPLKAMLKDISIHFPALEGSCEINVVPNLVEIIKGWAKTQYPHLNVEVTSGDYFHRGGGTQWQFLVDGEKVGDAMVSGYTGWGNIGYYGVGGDGGKYDKWTHSQCPPSLDDAKFLREVKAYLVKKFKGIKPDLFVAPPWDGDRVTVLNTSYSLQEQEALPKNRYHDKRPAGWVGSVSSDGHGQWISPDGGAAHGAWGYWPTPFKSKAKAKAVMDKKIQYQVNSENKRRNR